MKWHCGLLSTNPAQDRKLAWIKRGRWESLPEDVQDELRIWMAMPGFTANYHAQALGIDKRYIAKFIGGYEDLRSEVGENWLSATRDDSIRLCRLRGRGDIPVISQISMIDDLKAGRKHIDIIREYGVSRSTTGGLAKGIISFSGDLPLGFALLGAPRIK